MSGTSMACPHVAGVAALLQAEDQCKSPQQIAERISTLASNGKVSGLRGATPNKLLFAGGDLLSPTTAPSPVPQTWDQSKAYVVEHVHAAKYLRVAGGSGDGANVDIWDSPTSIESQWRITNINCNTYTLESVYAAGKY